MRRFRFRTHDFHQETRIMRRILPPASVAFGLVFSMLTTTAAFGGIRQQLNATLPEIPLNGVPFTDAIDFLRDVSGEYHGELEGPGRSWH